MKKLRNLMTLIALGLIVFILASCGSERGGASGVSDADEAADGSAASAAEQKEDDWGAVNGMSGTIEYEYDEDGQLVRMTLINGVTGTVYRRIEYSYVEDDWGTTTKAEMYGPNDILLYSVSTDCDTDGYLNYISGYDYFKEDASSYYNYQGGEYEVLLDSSRYDTYNEADDFWIQKYDDQGRIAERTYYFKDGSLIASETYSYDYQSAYDVEGAEYIMYYERVGGSFDYLVPVFDEDGLLIQYNDMTSYRYDDGETADEEYDENAEKVPVFTYEYDSESRLVKAVYLDEGEEDTVQTLTYNENGSVAQCVFERNQMTYTFTYEDGYLTCREGIATSIGSGDIGTMDYEYYESGVVKRLVCYSEFSHSDEDPEHLEYIYTFAEDGHLLACTDYDYCYQDASNMNSGFRDCRTTKFYGEDGTELLKINWVEETEIAEGEIELHIYSDEIDEAELRKVIPEEYHEELCVEKDLEEIEENETQLTELLFE
ncbi:MAG: hypothetical protein LUD01_10890 [Clostridiales bacterium]|nr:hypothetical protein [Clostridiales bacterium]